MVKCIDYFSEPVLSAVAWADDETVCAIWLNRIQNQAVITSCNSATAECAAVRLIELISTIRNVNKENEYLII